MGGGEGFWTGKDCSGLNECHARLYTAILRHIVLVMAAQLAGRTGTQRHA